VICIILFDLDYLHQQKEATSLPQNPGQRFLNWLPLSTHLITIHSSNTFLPLGPKGIFSFHSIIDPTVAIRCLLTSRTQLGL
jgi:hypothetical protein